MDGSLVGQMFTGERMPGHYRQASSTSEGMLAALIRLENTSNT